MEDKAKTKDQKKNSNNLSSFISTLGSNIGVSIATPKKKDTFSPYSAENQQQVQEIFDVMSSYKDKTSEREINVPKSVSMNKSGKKTQFEFCSEINADVFDEIVENKGLTNISLDQSSKVIEITK